jgi:hypothetical protein
LPIRPALVTRTSIRVPLRSRRFLRRLKVIVAAVLEPLALTRRTVLRTGAGLPVAPHGDPRADGGPDAQDAILTVLG